MMANRLFREEVTNYPLTIIMQGTALISLQLQYRQAGTTGFLRLGGSGNVRTATIPRYNTAIPMFLFFTFNAAFSGHTSVVIRDANKNILAAGTIAYATRSLTLELKHPDQNAQQGEQSTRYVLKSPVQNGAYTESVRELTPEQVARFRSRGFIVEGTTRGLSPPIKVTGNPQIRTVDSLQRVPRRGFTGQYMPPAYMKPKKSFIPKSTLSSSQRRAFSEPMLFQSARGFIREAGVEPHTTSQGQREYYVFGQNRNVRLSRRTAETLASRGWRLSLLPIGNNPVGARGSLTVNQERPNPPSGNLNPNDRNTELYRQNQRLADQLRKEREENYRRLQEEQKKVQNLINQLQDRANNSNDGDLIGLINSQIAELRAQTSKSLGSIDLQNTKLANDLLAQVDTKIRETVEAVQKGANDIAEKAGQAGGGVLDFLGNNQTLIYVFLAIMLIMVVKK